MADRRDILDRLRRSASFSPPEPPDGLATDKAGGRETADRPGPAECLAEFGRRWQANGGALHRVRSMDEAVSLLAGLISETGRQALLLAADAEAAWPGLAESLRARGIEPLSPADEQAADIATGLTSACAAVAYSGSLVVAGRESGTLRASLLPPVHVCLIRPDMVVYGLDEAMNRAYGNGMQRCAVFITGPSRTADIELHTVIGVHGPGAVHAVVIDPD